MAVGPGLTTGRYAMCFSCGEALSEADRGHAQYEEGVSCPLCFASTSDADKARFRTRHAQMTKAGVTQAQRPLRETDKGTDAIIESNERDRYPNPARLLAALR